MSVTITASLAKRLRRLSRERKIEDFRLRRGEFPSDFKIGAQVAPGVIGSSLARRQYTVTG